MPRTELIRRLADLDPVTPAACFVLLWTYFRHDEVGLPAVENRVRAQWGHVLRLPAPDLSAKDLLSVLNELQAQSGEPFDVLALQILKGLDALLNEGDPQDFDNAELMGIDGELHTVRSRNNFLASHGDVTWARRQGLSLAAYCPRFMVVPSHPVQGFRIVSRSLSSWGTRYLQDRLHAERESLRIMLWPLQCPLDYLAFEEMVKKPPPLHVSLDQLRNEPVIQAEVRSALEEARKEKVTLLILPELSIPPATALDIRRALAAQGVDGYPILTLFGCSHRRNDSGDLDVNEAVLLGPDGSELYRHRKLAPFTDYAGGEDYPCGENLETGEIVAVLECSLGNLTPLICLDLFNAAVRDVLTRSHGNLFAVPSLSPKTSAHQTAASDLQGRLLASTFVCNHWNDEKPHHQSTSFYQVPVSQGRQFHVSPSAPGAGKPYLLFKLGRLKK